MTFADVIAALNIGAEIDIARKELAKTANDSEEMKATLEAIVLEWLKLLSVVRV